MTSLSILLLGFVPCTVVYIITRILDQRTRLRECENCRYFQAAYANAAEKLDEELEEDLPPRVTRAIRAAAAALESDTAEDLTCGPRVWVDLDVISRFESADDDGAVSRSGGRGRYQITATAWNDTLVWLRCYRNLRITWPWLTAAHDPARARIVAGAYLNDVLPRQLTRSRFDAKDSTGPVPDSLDARVAAYHSGATGVRQAYARWQADSGTSLPWVAYLPVPTQKYLARYHEALEQSAIRFEKETR